MIPIRLPMAEVERYGCRVRAAQSGKFRSRLPQRPKVEEEQRWRRVSRKKRGLFRQRSAVVARYSWRVSPPMYGSQMARWAEGGQHPACRRFSR
jgi:hypothetical protein